jgi:gluconolactonase
MRVDRNGPLYVATRMGIQVCDQAGRVNRVIPTPNEKVSKLCFGGAQFDVLHATCGEATFKRKVKVKGANAFQAPIKPAPPRL